MAVGRAGADDGGTMDWDKLRVFHAVAEAGSFTHAGEALNLSQSAVSRQISALEESLSVPLFHRHARGLILTEQGELLFRTARDVFSKLSMTEAMLTESREHPKGPLKVTTTVAFGSLALSNHPGTASMGILLTLSLGYTLLTTLLVLPALFCPPVRHPGYNRPPTGA